MRAITIQNPEDPRSLTLTEVPDPELKPGEVLVKVHTAGVNRGDLMQAAGKYPAPPGYPDLLGLECAGEIVDPGDTGRRQGEKVCCLIASGGYAEYVAVPEGQLAPIPEGFSWVEAGAIAEAACTVWLNLGMLTGFDSGAEGKTVLIHGGSSGIGSMAIQVMKALGATVAVTAGTPEKLEYCKNLGADILINYRTENFADRLKNSCDAILDIIGAPYLEDNVRCLARDGHLIMIAMQGGSKPTQLSIARAFAKRATLHFSTLRARPVPEKTQIVASTVQHVWPLLADGTISPSVSATFPLADAASAHEALDSGRYTGKIVLTVAE